MIDWAGFHLIFDTAANKPTEGTTEQLFFETDTNLIYRGTGTGWQQLAYLNWKATAGAALDLVNQTADTPWTDLDLTSYTSSYATAAVCQLFLGTDTVGTGNFCRLRVRKNGISDTTQPLISVNKNLGLVGVLEKTNIVVALDSDQVIEYDTTVGTGWQADFYIRVMGYWE